MRWLIRLLIALLGVAILGAIGRRQFDRSSSLTSTVVSGQVAEQYGPVAGVRVRYQGSPDFVVTDEAGRFTLPAPAEPRTITAWKEGYTIGGQRSDQEHIFIVIRSLPDRDDADYQWLNPHSQHPMAGYDSSCVICHKDLYDEWRGSAHGQPHEGSHFRDMFLGLDARGGNAGWSLVRERPDGEKVCASCHNPAPITFFSRQVDEAGPKWGGVHCDFCHKIAGAEGEIGLTHGKYGLAFLRPPHGQLFFGPLEDAHRDEENTYSLFQKSSRLCASCHEGVVFGVKVYETYSEWQASPAGLAGVQCQQCHMKPTGKMTNIAPGHGGIERDPMTLANHTFFDGSRRDMLRNCLRVSLEVADGKAVVNIRVEGVGHRVPTGLPDRNLTLVVEAFDGDGKRLAKREKLYAKVLKDFDGHSPAPFWRAVPEFEDNRLTPGKPERVEFAVPAGTAKVSARLVYRKFWPEVARDKGWPDDAWVVAETEANPAR